MTNFDIAQSALETSLDSSGSAMEEHKKYMDSIEAKLNKLKAAWQSFSESFLDSSTLKAGVDILRSFVETLEWLIDNFGVLGTMGVGVGITGFFKAFSGAKDAKKNLNDVIKVIEILTNVVQSGTDATDQAAESDIESAAAKKVNTNATTENVAAKTAEISVDKAGAAADVEDAAGSHIAAEEERKEKIATEESIVAQTAEISVDKAGAAADAADAAGSRLAAEEERKEAEETIKSANAQTMETSQDVTGAVVEVTGAITDAGGAAIKSGKEIGVFAGSLGKTVGVIGLVVAAIGLVYTQYKKSKEAAAEARREVIESSNAYLDAADSFESAYIKYSGKTNLTKEEEEELAAAIDGTVDALGDKSSALQTIVNNSNDYVASLERIARAEAEAAKSAADEKKKALEEDLIETAMGWERFDGSEVDVNFGLGTTGNYDKAEQIAKEVAGDYFKSNAQGNNGEVVYSLTLDSDADVNDILDYYYTLVELKTALEDGLTEDELELDYSDEYKSLTNAIDKLKDSVKAYTDGVYDAVKANYIWAEGIPKTTEEFLEMREAILRDPEIASQSLDYRITVANSIDSAYKDKFDLSSAEAQAKSFIGLIGNYGDGTQDGVNEIGAVESLISMRTQVNGNECTVGQYLDQYNKVKELYDSWSEDEKKLFDDSLGFNSDEIIDYYDKTLDYVYKDYINDRFPHGLSQEATEIYKDEMADLLKGLSANELKAVYSIRAELDWENDTLEENLAKIREEAELIEAISFDIELEVEAEKLENLKTAIAESVSGSGLTDVSISLIEDMFGDLEGYDPSKIFERTANGIRLNTTEFRRLNDEYKKANIDGLDNKMSALGDRYNQTKEELYSLTYGTEEYNDKARELSAIEGEINDLERLASGYEGVASAYQMWQLAESSGSQRDMYEGVIEGFENLDDEISRGWLDDGTTEFLRLIYGDGISPLASPQELINAYNMLDDSIKNTTHSVRDFFTVNEDGDSTNDGVYNFLDTIKQLQEQGEFGDVEGLINTDESGNITGFNFDVVGGKEAIAETLKISEELVDIMVRAADDAGFVISMDGTYQQLDVLKEKAQGAANKLKELKITEHTFDLYTGDEDTILSDYEEALKLWEPFTKNKKEDGTIDMTVEGAEEAYTLVHTLQSMVDKLSEPAYMELNTSQVEKDLQTPLEKLQQYEELVQTEHQLNLKGADTSELKADKEEILNYFEDLQENQPEIAAALEIDGLTREELQQKIEAGEIKIPATIDLQVEMNNTLRDMVNIALYNSGLLGDKDGEGKEELKRRVDIELYAGEIDDSDVEEQIDNATGGSSSGSSSGAPVSTRRANVEIIAETIGEEDVDGLSSKLKGLDDKTIEAIAKVLGKIDVEKLGLALDGLDSTTVQAIAEAIGKGDVEGLKEEINKLHPTKVQAIAEALGYSSVEELNAAIENMDGNVVQAVAEALGLGDVKNLQAVIDGMRGNTVNAEVNTDGQAAKVTTLQDVIDGLKGKTVDIIINTFKNVIQTVTDGTKKSSKAGKNAADKRTGANLKTSKVNGTAFAQGNWRTKKSEKALTGELGREIVVTPNNQWYTVGDNGAEFVNIPRGSIVFNHLQTEELLSNGRAISGSGRATALVGGTAYYSGIGGIGKLLNGAVKNAQKMVEEEAKSKKSSTKKDSGSGSSGSSSDTSDGSLTKADKVNYGGTSGVDPKTAETNSDSSSTSSSSAKDDFEETIDLIEIAISRIEREIDNLDKKVNNVYASWSDRNNAITSEIGKIRKEIDLQQSAYDRYMQEANSVGLSSEWASKVQNGEIDIETITDEELKKKVDEYKQWYEKAISAKDAIEELKEQEAALYAQRVENVSTKFEGILGKIEHEKNMLEEYINQSETQGWLVSYNYYRALSSNEKRNIQQLEKQKAEMLAELQTAMESGSIERESESWYQMCSAIDEVSLAIEQANTRVMEISQTAQQLKWTQFDLLQDRISSITSETEFLIELLSSDKLYDDKGQLTDSGIATMGQHGVSYNTHMYQAEQAREEAERLQREIARNLYNGTDKYDTEMEERYREMIALQQEHILAAQQEKEAIRDMVEEGIQLELDALQELIDKKNEALDSERDLYEYQKKVKEQTKEIASLEKQLASYSGDDSEEAKQKVQKLKVDLESAREELKETEYDKYISDQQEMLDELYEQYSDVLNSRLDNLDALISDMIVEINTNADTISSTISEKADSVGYVLSDSMKTILDSSTASTNNVITLYGDKFDLAQTTTNNTLSTINSNLQKMIGQLNTIASTNVKSASVSSATNSKEANTSAKKDTTTSSSATSKPSGKSYPYGKASETTGNIQEGAKGNQVKAIQYALNQLGYGNSGTKDVDGNFGSGTKSAVRSFQKAMGISADGIVGVNTRAKFKANEYATGKKNFSSDEIAWTQDGGREFIIRPSDGAVLTPIAKKDSVLNTTASNNIWNMANSPAEFIRDNLGIGSANVPNNSTVSNNITQHFENINFNMPNVHGYNDLLTEMQRDPKFEKLVLSMTVDRIAGRSSLAKGKSIR